MKSFGNSNRNHFIDRISSEVFDVVVVGGGITGAGIARDAALRGLSTAVVERNDFSFGTSSRSSKLVHGGLRYLKNGEFGLVHESTTERNLLTSKIAPNLVRPLPFLVPIWENSKPGLSLMKAVLFMYDALGEFKNFRHFKSLSVREMLKRAPALRRNGLKGGLVYYDSVTDDTRLTLECIIDAVNRGAVALSRVEATSVEFKDGRVYRLIARDLVNKREILIHARSIITATGIWSQETGRQLDLTPSARLAIRPTKGTHIALPYEKFPIDSAVTMLAPQDKRAMFVIPWNGMTVLGTTDTDYQGDYGDVYASKWDVDYLLESARYNFQGFKATAADVVGTWAGLRPLIASEGSESTVSREHKIVEDDRGIITIAGGKLTTYRVMADQVLKAASRFFNKPLVKSTTDKVPLPCAVGLQTECARKSLVDELMNSFDLPERTAACLVTNHGIRARSVAALSREDRTLLNPLVVGHPFIRAEVVAAVRWEMALTLEDVLLRRTPVFFLSRDEDGAVIKDAAEIMAKECGWTDTRKLLEIKTVMASKAHHLACLI